jgi:hypothetical protein
MLAHIGENAPAETEIPRFHTFRGFSAGRDTSPPPRRAPGAQWLFKPEMVCNTGTDGEPAVAQSFPKGSSTFVLPVLTDQRSTPSICSDVSGEAVSYSMRT